MPREIFSDPGAFFYTVCSAFAHEGDPFLLPVVLQAIAHTNFRNQVLGA